MKILYFYQYFGTTKGGWSTRVYELTRRWVKDGHDVTVVTSPYDKSDIRGTGLLYDLDIEGVKIRVINIKLSNKHSLLRRSFTFFSFSLLSVVYALTTSCDVVITSSGPITIGVPGLIAKWLRRKKLVFEVRDLWPDGAVDLGILKNKWLIRLSYWFEELLYKNSDLVVSCSVGMQSRILGRYPATNTLVIPNASDVDLFGDRDLIREFELPEFAQTRPYFLYAGSLGLMDHGEIMLDAAVKLREINNKALIIIIGTGRERKKLIGLKDKLQLDNVYFIDLLPKNKIVGWSYYAQAVLVLFKNKVTIQTSSPNKLFDAFAAGKPVIQNTTGWIRDLVESNQCGINIEPDSSQGLCDAIVRLQQDDIAHEMGGKGLNLARTHFHRDTLSSNYISAIRALMV